MNERGKNEGFLPLLPSSSYGWNQSWSLTGPMQYNIDFLLFSCSSYSSSLPFIVSFIHLLFETIKISNDNFHSNAEFCSSKSFTFDISMWVYAFAIPCLWMAAVLPFCVMIFPLMRMVIEINVVKINAFTFFSFLEIFFFLLFFRHFWTHRLYILLIVDCVADSRMCTCDNKKIIVFSHKCQRWIENGKILNTRRKLEYTISHIGNVDDDDD